MKSLLTIIVFPFCILPVLAQDVIVHRDGKVAVCNIIEIDKESLSYKTADNPEGPLYTVPLKDVLSIRYENGKMVKLDDIQGLCVAPVSAVREEKKIEIPEEETSRRKHFAVLPEGHIRFDESTDEQKSKGGFGVELVANFQLSPSFMVGPGLGFNCHTFKDESKNGEVPIFVQARYTMCQTLLAPYLSAQAGYSSGGLFSGVDADSGSVINGHLGFFYNVGAGTSIKLKHGRLLWDVNYRGMQVSSNSYTGSSYVSYWGVTMGYFWSKN